VGEVAGTGRVLRERLVEQLDHPLDAGGGGVEGGSRLASERSGE